MGLAGAEIQHLDEHEEVHPLSRCIDSHLQVADKPSWRTTKRFDKTGCFVIVTGTTDGVELEDMINVLRAQIFKPEQLLFATINTMGSAYRPDWRDQ